MGFYVHWQISWGAGSLDEVVPVAKEWYDTLTGEDGTPTCEESTHFLEDIISGKAHFEGHKGDFWGWGTIGNYTETGRMLHDLHPFFKNLFVRGVLSESDRIVMFEEQEQSETVTITWLVWDDGAKDVVAMTTQTSAWYWGTL